MGAGNRQMPLGVHSEHTKDAIRKRLKQGPAHSYLRDFIYGATDGAVSTFAVVAGVAGADLSMGIVIILGFANLIGDGFSMAVSNFLGTNAERQLLQQARKVEEDHIEMVPEGEVEEVRQIYAAKGFEGEDLERAVKVITSDKERWIDTMVQEEFGLPLEIASPWIAAATTFFAFIAIGILPLIAFIYKWLVPEGGLAHPFLLSSILTGAAFFVIGAFKSRFVGQGWFLAGLETFGAGGVAALLAYFAGKLLKNVVQVL